jgi:hypothetical protein
MVIVGLIKQAMGGQKPVWALPKLIGWIAASAAFVIKREAAACGFFANPPKPISPAGCRRGARGLS